MRDSNSLNALKVAKASKPVAMVTAAACTYRLGGQGEILDLPIHARRQVS
jgi:hypothetical protein